MYNLAAAALAQVLCRTGTALHRLALRCAGTAGPDCRSADARAARKRFRGARRPRCLPARPLRPPAPSARPPAGPAAPGAAAGGLVAAGPARPAGRAVCGLAPAAGERVGGAGRRVWRRRRRPGRRPLRPLGCRAGAAAAAQGAHKRLGPAVRAWREALLPNRAGGRAESRQASCCGARAPGGCRAEQLLLHCGPSVPSTLHITRSHAPSPLRPCSTPAAPPPPWSVS